MERYRFRGQDFWAGIMFIGFGMLGLALSSSLRMGSAADMGPGYVPWMLSAVVAALGLIIAVRALVQGSERIDLYRFTPVVFVLAATLAFAGLLAAAGLIPAILALVTLATIGGRDFSVRLVLLLSIALSVFCIVIFRLVVGLHLDLFFGMI